jgi:tRNA-dihydrouridine synthase A
MLGLFAGQAGARAWRRHLSQEAVKPGADGAVIADALTHVTVAQRTAAE